MRFALPRWFDVHTPVTLTPNSVWMAWRISSLLASGAPRSGTPRGPDTRPSSLLGDERAHDRAMKRRHRLLLLLLRATSSRPTSWPSVFFAALAGFARLLGRAFFAAVLAPASSPPSSPRASRPCARRGRRPPRRARFARRGRRLLRSAPASGPIAPASTSTTSDHRMWYVETSVYGITCTVGRLRPLRKTFGFTPSVRIEHLLVVDAEARDRARAASPSSARRS